MSFPVINSGTSGGTGLLYSNVVYFGPTGTTTGTRVVSWTIPAGVTTCRVRLWGGGGGSISNGAYSWHPGGGGGFALKTITNLTPGTVTVTIGNGGQGGNNPGTGGTSSFGAYVSATGGRNAAGGAAVLGGVGTSGDVNMYGSGCTTGNGGGGNAGNLFIPYSGAASEFTFTSSLSITPMSIPTNPLDKIGTGYLFGAPSSSLLSSVTSTSTPNVNYFGNGVGGASGYVITNYYPSFPAGGAGTFTNDGQNYNGTYGGPGLVIVEY